MAELCLNPHPERLAVGQKVRTAWSYATVGKVFTIVEIEEPAKCGSGRLIRVRGKAYVPTLDAAWFFPVERKPRPLSDRSRFVLRRLADGWTVRQDSNSPYACLQHEEDYRYGGLVNVRTWAMLLREGWVEEASFTPRIDPDAYDIRTYRISAAGRERLEAEDA